VTGRKVGIAFNAASLAIQWPANDNLERQPTSQPLRLTEHGQLRSQDKSEGGVIQKYWYKIIYTIAQSHPTFFFVLGCSLFLHRGF